MKLLALNGGVRGETGDSQRALTAALAFAGDVDVACVVLASYRGTVEAMVELVRAADAFLVVTGTYWGSWGSPLQRFLEVMTPLEASDAFLAKPAACVVTMDSVGGSEVGARLLSTFTTLGCMTAPFPLVVLSRVGAAVDGKPGFDDVWQKRDLEVTMANLLASTKTAQERARFRAWHVEKGAVPKGTWPSAGELDLGLPDAIKPDTVSAKRAKR